MCVAIRSSMLFQSLKTQSKILQNLRNLEKYIQFSLYKHLTRNLKFDIILVYLGIYFVSDCLNLIFIFQEFCRKQIITFIYLPSELGMNKVFQNRKSYDNILTDHLKHQWKSP